ncbi:haloacid dehalogenase [Cellvibrio zantedeschiae]|uniref:Haloacid dehalogenase n=1 Tax=Cellvibrio zantedeschiae TaxID=1237077 RepID=A0ABQ3B415_9GAMM|nr:HAD family hydrolase [Cellvibrio zantedeschiae]GGY78390.1 haloacid dehalogenase [Cellvibrio zantedeschiae]
MRLAIFDLDNTLIAGDSDHSWGEFLVQKKLVDAQTYAEANDRFYQQYKAATLDIHEYLSFSLAPLTQYSLDDLAVLHAEFMRELIEPMMLPKAKALLQQHRDQGDYLLIITATNSFVTHPIAAHLGVDDILASDAEIKDGRYTGKGTGTPCFQSGKVVRLQEWLKQKNYNLDDAYFYSDSINDLPLLEQVPNPIAVDADERLSKIALERGWKHISLRD